MKQVLCSSWTRVIIIILLFCRYLPSEIPQSDSPSYLRTSKQLLFAVTGKVFLLRFDIHYNIK